MYWGVESYIPGPAYLAIALIQVDMGLVQEEGQDAGVESVCYDNSANTQQGNAASEVFHMVKMFVHIILDFIL